MRPGRLSYNGTTYTLAPDEIKRLLEAGVIQPDPGSSDAFELAPEHLIEELGDDVLVVSRQTGAEARGEGTGLAEQRMLAVRYMHSHAPGGVGR